MSFKAKLSFIFSLTVALILISNTILSYYSTENLLREKYRNQMNTLSKSIAVSVEHQQFGVKYLEDQLGHELRTASIAVKYALNPDIDKVTNEELIELKNELDVTHISLFERIDDDIVATKSSDPKEINVGSKTWGYWFTAFNQLFDEQKVTIEHGQKLENYWSGPYNISYSDPDYIDKWGYFYDGTTNYIIDPFFRADTVQEFENKTGPERMIERMMSDHPGFLEITGFNPETFGKERKPEVVNGVEYFDYETRPILFGTYTYKQDNKDIQAVNKAVTSNETVGFEAELKDKKVIKTFIPVDAEKPYVIGIVMDNSIIQSALNEHLLNSIFISIGLLLLVISFSYFLSGYVVKPVLQIMNKVKEISTGRFGAHITTSRNDEFGLLADGVNRMSSNLANFKEQLEYQAYYDELTELPNRRLFHEKLKQSIMDAEVKNEQVAVMFFDLDRFKSVNDIFGHSIGDLLLREVGHRVSSHLEGNNMLFRMGGDEFTVIVTESSRAKTKALARKILDIMTVPFLIDGYEIIVTPSIGISLYPDDANSVDVLLKNTDIAMYRAKNQGKNSYQFFIPEFNEAFFRKVQLEKDLHKALENHEFFLHYQPQVDIRNGKIIGVEALVRWQHPELGLVSPGEFIPLAEEAGIIIPLGEWVLRTACSQMKEWHNAGYPLFRVAVNLSARQFQQGNLAKTVTRILEETGLKPEYLELEITESMAIQDADYTTIKLNQLKEIGIKISMDDFGTGYSSLSYLKTFPIDKLKVDKSFVDDICINQDNEIMIKTIITMAHNLNLEVIAEGVETEQQLKFLNNEQCDEVQGYFFSEPLSVDDFELKFKEINEVVRKKLDL